MLRFSGAVDLDVARAADLVENAFHFLELVVHVSEILAVDFDDDLPADAADGFLDPIFDGLTEVVVDAGTCLEIGPHGFDDLLLASLRLPLHLGSHQDECLGLVRSFVVRTVFGVALLAEHVAHFGESEKSKPYVAEHLRAALERRLRRHGDGDVDVALVHLRKKLGSETRNEHDCHDEQRDAREAGDGWMLERPAQSSQITIAQVNQEPRFDVSHLAMAQEHDHEGGDGGEREEQRPGQRKSEGEGNGTENPALDALQRENRQHRSHDDGQREEDGTYDLLRG